MNASLLQAYALDLAIGDPRGIPHPVRWIGSAISRGERLVRARFPHTPAGERLAGFVLAGTIVGGAAGCSALLLAVTRRRTGPARKTTELLLAASTLATRDLLSEVLRVHRALAQGDLPRARCCVARIVGRDTDRLDEAAIARAAIETLAESTCDGVVAPLFFLALGGVPAAMAFKAASTLDSMIGHFEPPYRHLGMASARLDDVANFVPARLSAFAIVALAGLFGSASGAARVIRADARAHRSPNAGYPEAAIAGALGVRLGGPLSYDGIATETPLLNATGRTPNVEDLGRAIGLCAASSALVALVMAALTRRG